MCHVHVSCCKAIGHEGPPHAYKSNLQIPVVTVLISGRPLVTNRELNASGAFVAAWLPGSEGQGVADVLFGDENFSGKLSFSWPEHPEDRQNFGAANYAPLFPYGFGLTY